ncbi:hypothetical protein Tco_1204585 [Tanacetum coccineum]
MHWIIMLSLSDLNILGGGGIDEGSATSKLGMHALADGSLEYAVFNRTSVLYGICLRNKMNECGEVGGVELIHSLNASVSFTTSSSSLSSSDDSLSSLSPLSTGWHPQVEADPLLVPLAPHQKLTGISMAQN